MKTNYSILGILVGILVGVGIGYFVFRTPDTEHIHQEESTDNSIWTCSMHPQIRMEEPGLCPICEMDLIPLEASNGETDPLVFEMSEEAVRLASVQTSVVSSTGSDPEAVLALSGKIQADERRASSQVAHLPGRIERLYVSFTGEAVRKGQPIADIYSPSLITAQQEYLVALKLEETNPGLLESATNKLRYWKVSEEWIDQLAAGGEIRETFTLTADATGVVEQRRVQVGDYLEVGEVLFDLINLSEVWVLFDVYEEDLPGVKEGQQIRFTTPAIPGKEFESTINFIDPRIDPESRVVRVRGEVSNPAGALKPEMLVRGLVSIVLKSDAPLSVPKTAVLWTGKRSVVYVKMPDTSTPTFMYREIELGQKIGDQYEVLSGLESGEEVVTNGVFMVDAAVQLNNQQSMINQLVLEEEKVPDYHAEATAELLLSLEQIGIAYLKVKDQLVASDPEGVVSSIAELLASLNMVASGALEDPAEGWWQGMLSDIQFHTKKLSESNDLEVQREEFSSLSDLLIRSFQAFGVSSETFYVQHCPMAFENEGADWLAAEQEINNPYFGDRMLRCGLVEEVFQPEGE